MAFVIADKELKIDIETTSYVYFTGKIFVHFMRTAFNPFMPNGISHPYQLEQSISVLRDVRWYFHFYSSFNRKLCKQTVETLIRRRILWRLIWVCAICLCPIKDARHILVKNAIILLIS